MVGKGRAMVCCRLPSRLNSSNSLKSLVPGCKARRVLLSITPLRWHQVSSSSLAYGNSQDAIALLEPSTATGFEWGSGAECTDDQHVSVPRLPIQDRVGAFAFDRGLSPQIHLGACPLVGLRLGHPRPVLS